jgi:hypothetical protein
VDDEFKLALLPAMKAPAHTIRLARNLFHGRVQDMELHDIIGGGHEHFTTPTLK